MTENDTYIFQRERIIRVVAEKAPGKEVQFDERSWIKFRVVDPAAPSISLTEPTGEWIPSEFGDTNSPQTKRCGTAFSDCPTVSSRTDPASDPNALFDRRFHHARSVRKGHLV